MTYALAARNMACPKCTVDTARTAICGVYSALPTATGGTTIRVRIVQRARMDIDAVVYSLR